MIFDEFCIFLFLDKIKILSKKTKNKKKKTKKKEKGNTKNTVPPSVKAGSGIACHTMLKFFVRKQTSLRILSFKICLKSALPPVVNMGSGIAFHR